MVEDFIMNVQTKKKCTFFIIAIFFLLGGIEYAVILPSLWLYLKERFNAEPYFLGMTLSAFSFSGLFAGPLLGSLSDKTHHTKWILLFANMWEIVGNIMYFVGTSKWMVLGGRLVVGVGASVGAAIIADIARVTTSEERTRVLSVFMAIRQFGLVFGPAFNLFLRKLDFYIGPYKVDKYTSPGAFMAVIWVIFQFLVVFLYYELVNLRDEELRENLVYSDGPTLETRETNESTVQQYDEPYMEVDVSTVKNISQQAIYDQSEYEKQKAVNVKLTKDPEPENHCKPESYSESVGVPKRRTVPPTLHDSERTASTLMETAELMIGASSSEAEGWHKPNKTAQEKPAVSRGQDSFAKMHEEYSPFRRSEMQNASLQGENKNNTGDQKQQNKPADVDNSAPVLPSDEITQEEHILTRGPRALDRRADNLQERRLASDITNMAGVSSSAFVNQHERTDATQSDNPAYITASNSVHRGAINNSVNDDGIFRRRVNLSEPADSPLSHGHITTTGAATYGTVAEAGVLPYKPVGLLNDTASWEISYEGGNFRSKLRFFYDEYIREEVIAILAAGFAAYFNQLALETMVTPLTRDLLGWGELENSLLYCACGVEILIVFGLIMCVSKKVSDRVMLIGGMVLEMCAVAWFLFFIPPAKNNDPDNNLWFMVLGTIIDVFGLPVLVVTSTSLFTKITREETQGLSQGLRRTVSGLAFIMGPLWAGALLHKMYLMLGVMLGMMCLVVFMLLLSFKYLTEPEDTQALAEEWRVTPTGSVQEEDERRPLLA